MSQLKIATPHTMTDDEREAWIEEARVAMVAEPDETLKRFKMGIWMARRAKRNPEQIERMEQARMARIEAGQ